MAFERPTLSALIDRIRNDFLQRLEQDEVLRRSDLEVQSRVHAAAVHALYGFISYLADQLLPDRADEEWLERHASLWNVPRKQAAKATGSVTFTTTVGAVLPVGTRVRALDAVEYETTAAVTATTSTAVLPVQAVLAGASGNRATGQTLTLVSPVAGVQASVVAGELSGGADLEVVELWRARLLERLAQAPHGGSSFDYVMWAKEVAGVTRAWVAPQELGAGTVVVRFVRDADVSLIPDAGEVAAVQSYIDARRPVTAQVTVVAPVAVALNFTIDATPDTPTIRAAIEAELRDLLLRDAQPGGTILISRIREAISIASGESDHVLVSPTANITHATGQMAVFGAITWQ